jgi:hypothetical protein
MEHLKGVPKDICSRNCEKRLIPLRKIGHETASTMDPIIHKRKNIVKKKRINEQKEDILNKNPSNTNQDEIKEKICPGKNCTHAGVFQPIGQFETKASKNVYETCNTCRMLELENVEKAIKEHLSSPKKELIIDFKDHPDIYNELIQLAEDKLRKPEKQALWMFVKIYEKGLKTFPEFQD